jgi:hypothetical protein
VNDVSAVDVSFLRKMLSSADPVTVDDVIPPVPVISVIRIPPSFTALPLLDTLIHASDRFLVVVARIPLSVEF